MSIYGEHKVTQDQLKERATALRADKDGLREYMKRALQVSAAVLDIIHEDPNIKPNYADNFLYPMTYNPMPGLMDQPAPERKKVSVTIDPLDNVLLTKDAPSQTGMTLSVTDKYGDYLVLYTPLGGLKIGINNSSVGDDGSKEADMYKDLVARLSDRFDPTILKSHRRGEDRVLTTRDGGTATVKNDYSRDALSLGKDAVGAKLPQASAEDHHFLVSDNPTQAIVSMVSGGRRYTEAEREYAAEVKKLWLEIYEEIAKENPEIIDTIKRAGLRSPDGQGKGGSQDIQSPDRNLGASKA